MMLEMMALIALLNAGAAPPVHEHHPPRHGTLVELGEEFAHLELVLDSTVGTLTAYALDGEAEEPVRLAEKTIGLHVVSATARGGTAIGSFDLELAPVANPLTGETAEDTSEYRVRADRLKDLTAFDAVIVRVNIRGGTFTAVKFHFPEGNDPHRSTEELSHGQSERK